MTKRTGDEEETIKPVAVADDAIDVAGASDEPQEEDLGEPAPYEAKVIDPPEPEPLVAAQPEEAPLEIPTGYEAIEYRGVADMVEHGAFRFRRGEPVAVPSDVAEELLTLPFEHFERV
jgi:hypothetical protein